ncbi:polyadenylate-binding protein 2-B-like isoform X1 [Pocillopora verrucosa]|uniref:polyadenylate-binding protein 2-B-like isoform X1 n=1 Tax=Pocillopora damicornis TaxID=46731 RepID=UPI000F555B34|nr:polyadenylate-binding protein 2-B-like isoform X1 [Pocillopora damicornis]XP_058972990.1 polyadenylate-binding protein 2-B-like isoform X1 [Pocillopora verrucosa]
MADLDESAQDSLLDAALHTSKDDDAVLGDISGVDPTVDDSLEDPELEAIKARVKEMEEEAEKLKEMQKQVEESIMSPTVGQSTFPKTIEEKGEIDARSVYVGNVDYSATAEELEQHFHGCGSVNRVTILCDKFTGHPKGFAYIEFADKESVENAVTMDDSLFKGRQIKVNPKRTNRPGISTTDRGSSRGRGRGRGFRGGLYNPYANFMPRPRGRAMFRSVMFSLWCWCNPFNSNSDQC